MFVCACDFGGCVYVCVVGFETTTICRNETHTHTQTAIHILPFAARCVTRRRTSTTTVHLFSLSPSSTSLVHISRRVSVWCMQPYTQTQTPPSPSGSAVILPPFLRCRLSSCFFGVALLLLFHLLSADRLTQERRRKRRRRPSHSIPPPPFPLCSLEAGSRHSSHNHPAFFALLTLPDILCSQPSLVV